MTQLSIETHRKDEMLLVTRQVQEAVTQQGVQNGMCVVFCPHTTAGLTLNENADPDVVQDILFGLERAFPDRPEFRHFEGNSSAHLKASAVGSSVMIPIQDGQLAAGRWQGIWFCEFDGPRNRQFWVQILESGA